MLNDIGIIKRIREGDIQAFEAVFKQYYAPLCLYAASLAGRPDVGEEIVQELFYVCWREKEHLNVLHSLKSYLYAAARNGAFHYLEHQAVRKRYQDTVASATAPVESSPQDQLEYMELYTVIDRTLLHLPERRRLIFNMHRFNGMTYAEIAHALSLSVKTVEAEMSKTLQTLRKEVEKYTQIA